MTSDFEFNSSDEFGDYELSQSIAVIEAIRAAAAAVEASLRIEAVREHSIDAALEDSFPASDPPCWTLGHTGG